MLKKVNFILSSVLPQKLYWHLAGLIHPWEAILENCSSIDGFYSYDRGLVDLLQKLKLINKSTAVLDIGCGAGRIEYSLAPNVKECTGIDIAPSMVKLAKKHVNQKNVKFIVVDGQNLKIFPDKKFNLVFSLLVFQHLPRAIFFNYLVDSYRVLKKGGKLFFQILLQHGSIKNQEPPNNHPWAVRLYTLAELKNHLENIGFTNLRFLTTSGQKVSGKEENVFVVGEK